MADSSPTDRAALKAWYEANFQPTGAAPSGGGDGARRPSATGRQSRPITRPPPASDADDHDGAAAAAAADRRAQLEHTRQQARKKSLRWRLALFCFMLAGTIVAAFAIYVVIQQKFGGKIPYFESLD